MVRGTNERVSASNSIDSYQHSCFASPRERLKKIKEKENEQEDYKRRIEIRAKTKTKFEPNRGNDRVREILRLFLIGCRRMS